MVSKKSEILIALMSSFKLKVSNNALQIKTSSPKKNRIHAFWWSQKVNFGDLITSELIQHYGYIPVLASRENADMVAVGSLLQMLNHDYRGIILGTGLIEDIHLQFDHAKIIAVRGELTKTNLGLPMNTETGDLGLLGHRLLRQVDNYNNQKYYSVGLILHYADKMHPWVNQMKHYLGESGCVIEVQDSAINVIDKINKCDTVVSSSLHGLIVADALGKPNAWIELSNNVIGSGFKFRDYNSSVDYDQPCLSVNDSTNMKDVERVFSNKSATIIKKKQARLETLFNQALKMIVAIQH